MNSRAKGQRGEREWANVLRARFPHLEFQRGLQARSGGRDAADVEGLPSYHQEVKRVEALNIWKAEEQATADADPGDIPIVPHRRNLSSWWVSVPAEHFLDLVESRMRRAGGRPHGGS